MDILSLSLLTLLLPLIGSLIIGLAGLFGIRLTRELTNVLAIAFMGGATICALLLLMQVVMFNLPPTEFALYPWLDFMTFFGYRFEMGFLIDKLSVTMMLVVCFVSLIIHLYTIGYMDHDEDYADDNPYYQRFFSYISLFTFAMLALVISNNFLQLFFAWEIVGLVSYLLIGFYMKRESAVRANLKAFLLNRVSDLGFLLGIALIWRVFGSLNYHDIFMHLEEGSLEIAPMYFSIEWLSLETKGIELSIISVMTICLFIGAMGKSAQMPLHTWLPDSMEGPTPISALIHAATMVTAGIYMIVRVHPLFLESELTLSIILIIGSTTAVMMGALAVVQNDIKRVIAYSTLSQLGYMVAALGVAAFVGGFFHVFTHAFFKALLFLTAGSVIIALHHIQDIRQMGGLKKYMPITYWCMLVASLSLIGIPGFSGFFSKDIILLSVNESDLFGSTYAQVLLLISVFLTAFYSFRLFFMVFHNAPSPAVSKIQPKESYNSINISLLVLAIPSVLVGWLFIDSWFFRGYFINVFSDRDYSGGASLLDNYASSYDLLIHAFSGLPLYLSLGGVLLAWLLYIKYPNIVPKVSEQYSKVHNILLAGYGFDALNNRVFVNGSIKLGAWFWRWGDRALIDDGIVNSAARWVSISANKIRLAQSGFVYHYAFVIIFSVMLFLGWITYNNIL